MLRHVRWGQIFSMTVILFMAATTPSWLPLVAPEEETTEEAASFSCPPSFEAEVCAVLAEIDAENPLESAAMLDALFGDPIPAPANEVNPESVEADIDKEAVSAFTNTLIRTGRFTEVNALHRAEGVANIYELVADGQISRYLRFENEFNTTRGPDLRVYLSINAEPRTREEMFANGTAIEVGLLKGTIGGQNYALGVDVDITRYRSVVIFSGQYGRIFSTAPLEQPIR